jgi:hypothetical protein
LTRFQNVDTPWRFGKVRGLIINYVAVLYVFITSIVSHTLHQHCQAHPYIVLLLPACSSSRRQFNEYVSRPLFPSSYAHNRVRLRVGCHWHLCHFLNRILGLVRKEDIPGAGKYRFTLSGNITDDCDRISM